MIIFTTFAAVVSGISDWIISTLTTILAVVLWSITKLAQVLWSFVSKALSSSLKDHPYVHGIFNVCVFLAVFIIIIGLLVLFLRNVFFIIAGITLVSIAAYLLPALMHFVIGTIIVLSFVFLLCWLWSKVSPKKTPPTSGKIG